jgi:tetratricopeptide (TPR) repeat protein
MGVVLTALSKGNPRFRRPDVIDLLKRGAILHTDIATASMIASHKSDTAASDAFAVRHFNSAEQLADAVRGRASNDPFLHSWWVAVAAFLHSQREVAATPLFIERALSVLPGEAELLLMAGTAHELRASPRVQEAVDLPPGFRDVVGGRAVNLNRAEARFRGALRSRGDLVEAQVRLGRVLALKGQHRDALTELAAARDRATDAAGSEQKDPVVQYYLFLFLGQEEQALGNHEAARASYKRALGLFPTADSAALALSRFEHLGGERAAAVDAIVSVMQRPSTPQGRNDPWREYYNAGPGRHSAELLDDLRRPFRRHP